jgi:hypothetical protein
MFTCEVFDASAEQEIRQNMAHEFRGPITNALTELLFMQWRGKLIAILQY